MAENWVRICAESDLEENWGEVAWSTATSTPSTRPSTASTLATTSTRTARHWSSHAASSVRRTATPPSPPPLYKEVYDLTTGECVSDPSYSIKVYPVEVRDGDVYLKTA